MGVLWCDLPSHVSCEILKELGKDDLFSKVSDGCNDARTAYRLKSNGPLSCDIHFHCSHQRVNFGTETSKDYGPVIER